MTWKKLNDKQVVKQLDTERVVVVAPVNFESFVIPLFCSLCSFPMKTQGDSMAYRKVKLCERCDYRWTGRLDDLDKESQDWIDYIEERVLLSKPIINIR